MKLCDDQYLVREGWRVDITSTEFN